MASAKAAKIWKRTWIGATMVAVTWGLLWIASKERTGSFMLLNCSILGMFGVLEVARMGSLKALNLFMGLVLAWSAAFAFGLLAVANRMTDLPYIEYLQGYSANFALEAGVVFAIPFLLSRFRSGFSPSGGPLIAPAIALWTILPLMWIHHIPFQWGGAGLVALIIMSKIGDTAGYFTGNAIGKSHPFPNISPGKTTAGCVASLIAGTAAGGACVAMELLPEPKLGLAGGFLCGALINVAAQAGDLLESRLKRLSGVKDSGTCFGPAGGVLDMTDSLLLTVPTAIVTWPLLFSAVGG